MGRIAVFENPVDRAECSEYEHSGPLIDFLLDKFPVGFGGRPHLCSFNLGRLPVADYDKVVEDSDVVTISVLPALEAAAFVAMGMSAGSAATAAVVANAAIGYAASQALNYTINRFFGTKGTQPSSPSVDKKSLPEASPTYTLGSPSNQARLGQPVPVAYGRNLLVPDLASQPYSWFYDNYHWIGLILCLGQGHFRVHKILVGNTELSTMDPSTIKSWVLSPSDHLSNFGYIGTITGEAGSPGIYENVYTSPEVANQELLAPTVSWSSPQTTSLLPTNFTSTGQIFMELGQSMFVLDLPATSYAGSQSYVRISGTLSDDGDYTVTWVAPVYDPDSGFTTGTAGQKGSVNKAAWVSWPSSANFEVSLAPFPDEETPSPPPVPTPQPSPVPLVGPFAVTPAGVYTEMLQYDYSFPNGAYSVDDDGGINAIAVEVCFYAERIDDDGNVIGATYETKDYTVWQGTTAQRRTLYLRDIPLGRYRVSARRLSAKGDPSKTQSDVFWTGLKAVLGNTFGGDVYGDTTLLVIKAKASDYLSGDALSSISVDCTRYDPARDIDIINPADVVHDIIWNPTYGGNRPSEEIDWDTLNALHAQWDTDGRTFDAVYDSPTNLWDAMRACLQKVHTTPTMDGSLITFVEDKDYTVGEILFTQDMVKSLSLTFMFPDGNEVDGVEIEYRDPNDNAQLFAIYPADSVNPEKSELWGCRDYDEALAYATRRWKQLYLRRLLISMDVELEGQIVRVGAPVSIIHPKLDANLDPVLCVVNAVKPKDEFEHTIELHRHESGVFA
jgi:hypothetical protein